MPLDIPFWFQMNVWGYALLGPEPLEFSALVSENHQTDIRQWDRNATYLNSQTLTRDGQDVPIPESWALPWVTEDRLRHELQEAV